jgi:glycolate oxidase iron-sulfur subunit
MKDEVFINEVSKCVRCGTCKSVCPTYLTSLNESMGARGRIAMLGELCSSSLAPSNVLADRIFNCLLCGACKGLCPLGINIPEAVYHGRTLLRGSYKKGRLIRAILKYSISRMDTAFSMLRGLQKVLYRPLYKAGRLRYAPDITPHPFKSGLQVYKSPKKIGRVAIFTGCSINYLYPHLGDALIRILNSKRYEVVVFKGEVCCGAPLRDAGLKEETDSMAARNIDLYKKIRAEAVISMCPTCTMVIKEQYPVLTGETIPNMMDVNEFFIKNDITRGLELAPQVVTYHDPCHTRYGMGLTKEPREILNSIEGLKYVEMKGADECCGFGGFFSLNYRDMSRSIGKKKFENINNTLAGTVVSSCPGCVMQLEDIQRETKSDIKIKHIVEVVDEAMHG